MYIALLFSKNRLSLSYLFATCWMEAWLLSCSRDYLKIPFFLLLCCSTYTRFREGCCLLCENSQVKVSPSQQFKYSSSFLLAGMRITAIVHTAEIKILCQFCLQLFCLQCQFLFTEIYRLHLFISSFYSFVFLFIRIKACPGEGSVTA